MHNWQIHFIILAFVLCFFLPIGFNLINRCLCAVGWTWKLFVCDIWFNRQDSLSIYFLFYLTFFCKVHGVFHLKKKTWCTCHILSRLHRDHYQFYLLYLCFIFAAIFKSSFNFTVSFNKDYQKCDMQNFESIVTLIFTTLCN